MITTQSSTFTNPFWPENFPDPFLIKVRGRYYAYATERATSPPEGSLVFPILMSTDMISWREIGKALPAFGSPYQMYWAPEVTVYNGQFLLYYAVHTEEFVSSIRVAVADRPEGPFIDSGHALTASLTSWAIDPHVFRDQDGQWYLYMTIEYQDSSQDFVGSGNAVARMLDPFTLQGNITRVTPPSQKWQLFEAQRQSKGGIDWYTVEGPTVVRHRGRYYEMFSGGCFYRDNYAVSYATSNIPMGPGGLRDTSWQDWQGRTGHDFLMQGDREHFISPGHNSLVPGPNNADDYIIYHAIQPQHMIERIACMDRLFWQGDDLWTPAPTFTPQPAPTMPRIRELFETPDLASSWQPQEGSWSVARGEVIQESEMTEVATLHHRSRLSRDWLLEANLRFTAGSGSYGLVLLNSPKTMTIQLEITSDAQLVLSETMHSVGNDVVRTLRTVSLPQHVNVQAWHQLLISFSGFLLTVQFDGQQLLEIVLEQSIRTFALLTRLCSAAFSGISLTDHFRNEFLNDQYNPAQLGWQLDASIGNNQCKTLSNWRIQEGALEQISTAQGEHLLLKGSPQLQYEFGATMRLRQSNAHAQAAFGLVLLANPLSETTVLQSDNTSDVEHDGDGRSNTKKLFIGFEQRQSGWMLIAENGSAQLSSLALPENFDPSIWHTLRLEHWKDVLVVSLDGPKIFTLPVPRASTSVGLVTRNAAAAFTSVWQTGRPMQ